MDASRPSRVATASLGQQSGAEAGTKLAFIRIGEHTETCLTLLIKSLASGNT